MDTNVDMNSAMDIEEDTDVEMSTDWDADADNDIEMIFDTDMDIDEDIDMDYFYINLISPAERAAKSGLSRDMDNQRPITPR